MQTWLMCHVLIALSQQPATTQSAQGQQHALHIWSKALHITHQRKTAPKRPDAILFTVGMLNTQTRDQHVSTRRKQGSSWQVGLGLEASDRVWIDRLLFSYHQGSVGDLERQGGEILWMIQRNIWSGKTTQLFLGGNWRTSINYRTDITTSWDALSTLELGTTLRKTIPISTHQLWFDMGLSTPLIGLLARPGHAWPLKGRSLDLEDVELSTPHNVLGITQHNTVTWRRPNGADLQLQLTYRIERIATPQPLTRAQLNTTLSALWRF